MHLFAICVMLSLPASKQGKTTTRRNFLMKTGAFTALITPFKPDGRIDKIALRRNIEFQIAQGIDGLVSCGSTGESPTLTPDEHAELNAFVAEAVASRVYVLAGVGSNNPDEAMDYALEAAHAGADGLLLVDCYYNKPTSGQLVDFYYGPIAETIASVYPNKDIIPYIIPGRTGGTGLQPEELCELAAACPNVTGVKESIGITSVSIRIRELLGPEFVIMCGDDSRAFEMMVLDHVRAQGLISVISNALPGAVSSFVHLLQDGHAIQAAEIHNNLTSLFSLVSMKAIDAKRGREFTYPNPCSIKYIMKLLNMDSGFLRPPLGPLPETVREQVIMILTLLAENSHCLEPVFAAYGKPEIIGAYTH